MKKSSLLVLCSLCASAFGSEIKPLQSNVTEYIEGKRDTRDQNSEKQYQKCLDEIKAISVLRDNKVRIKNCLYVLKKQLNKLKTLEGNKELYNTLEFYNLDSIRNLYQDIIKWCAYKYNRAFISEKETRNGCDSIMIPLRTMHKQEDQAGIQLFITNTISPMSDKGKKLLLAVIGYELRNLSNTLRIDPLAVFAYPDLYTDTYGSNTFSMLLQINRELHSQVYFKNDNIIQLSEETKWIGKETFDDKFFNKDTITKAINATQDNDLPQLCDSYVTLKLKLQQFGIKIETNYKHLFFQKTTCMFQKIPNEYSISNIKRICENILGIFSALIKDLKETPTRKEKCETIREEAEKIQENIECHNGDRWNKKNYQERRQAILAIDNEMLKTFKHYALKKLQEQFISHYTSKTLCIFPLGKTYLEYLNNSLQNFCKMKQTMPILVVEYIEFGYYSEVLREMDSLNFESFISKINETFENQLDKDYQKAQRYTVLETCQVLVESYPNYRLLSNGKYALLLKHNSSTLFMLTYQDAYQQPKIFLQFDYMFDSEGY